MLSGFISLENIKSVAIGAFDGMHRGHQELFKRLKNGAIVVIEKNNALLTPGKERCRYVKEPCLFLNLQEIKELDSTGFAKLLKSYFPSLKEVVVGYDFAFGKERKYAPKDLEPFFDVEVVDEVKVDGISVHSRVIKDLLREGNVSLANRLLGRNYCIKGRVIKGQGLGKEKLFATLNLEVKDFLIPKEGVYASFTIVNKKRYRSVTFIGRRVSTDNGFAIETHIIEPFEEEEVEEVEICFVKYLRENRKFDSLKELKAQIQRDIERAEMILKR